MTPDPIYLEAAVLAAAHRRDLQAAAPSERPKIRKEILRRLRQDMTRVRESIAENAFIRHKALYAAFRTELDAMLTDSGAVKAHA